MKLLTRLSLRPFLTGLYLKYFVGVGPLLPALSATEEEHLGRLAAAGDREARRELVRRNYRFAVVMSRSFERSGVSSWRLLRAGVAGLKRAAEHYNTAHNVRYISYASYWVRQRMTQEVHLAHHGPLSFRDRILGWVLG